MSGAAAAPSMEQTVQAVAEVVHALIQTKPANKSEHYVTISFFLSSAIAFAEFDPGKKPDWRLVRQRIKDLVEVLDKGLQDERGSLEFLVAVGARVKAMADAEKAIARLTPNVRS